MQGLITTIQGVVLDLSGYFVAAGVVVTALASIWAVKMLVAWFRPAGR